MEGLLQNCRGRPTQQGRKKLQSFQAGRMPQAPASSAATLQGWWPVGDPRHVEAKLQELMREGGWHGIKLERGLRAVALPRPEL